MWVVQWPDIVGYQEYFISHLNMRNYFFPGSVQTRVFSAAQEILIRKYFCKSPKNDLPHEIYNTKQRFWKKCRLQCAVLLHKSAPPYMISYIEWIPCKLR